MARPLDWTACADQGARGPIQGSGHARLGKILSWILFVEGGFFQTPSHLVYAEGSATHLKSCTGCLKSCEIFESLLILKSEIFKILYDILYIFGYKFVNSASLVPINS